MLSKQCEILSIATFMSVSNLCAIDLSKAFDKVNHHVFLEIDEKTYSQSAIRPIGILDIQLLFICEMAHARCTNV